MSKYEILEKKLKDISDYIEKMIIKDEATRDYMAQYKDYVNKLINAVQKESLRNSDGAVLGLMRGVSEYDEICADNILWNMLADADKYYSKECKSF